MWTFPNSTWKGQLKNVQDEISRPLGIREIQKTKVETVLVDTLYVKWLIFPITSPPWITASPLCLMLYHELRTSHHPMARRPKIPTGTQVAEPHGQPLVPGTAGHGPDQPAGDRLDALLSRHTTNCCATNTWLIRHTIDLHQARSSPGLCWVFTKLSPS